MTSQSPPPEMYFSARPTPEGSMTPQTVLPMGNKVEDISHSDYHSHSCINIYRNPFLCHWANNRLVQVKEHLQPLAFLMLNPALCLVPHKAKDFKETVESLLKLYPCPLLQQKKREFHECITSVLLCIHTLGQRFVVLIRWDRECRECPRSS